MAVLVDLLENAARVGFPDLTVMVCDYEGTEAACLGSNFADLLVFNTLSLETGRGAIFSMQGEGFSVKVETCEMSIGGLRACEQILFVPSSYGVVRVIAGQ